MINKNLTINPIELKAKINKAEKIQIIDIREMGIYHNPIPNSEWIPASILLSNLEKLKKDIPVILYCRLGVDSFCLVNILHSEYQLSLIHI